jgi:hypothetical protein
LRINGETRNALIGWRDLRRSTVVDLFKRLFHSGAGEFRTRSAERDRQTDANLIGNVGKAIASALTAFENERDGLHRRISEVHMLASITVGNATDEYVTREPAKAASLAAYESEMKRGRERLNKLEDHINNLKFLRAACQTRFGQMQ